MVVVPQAHDVDDDTHFVDAEQLWDEGDARGQHGFSRRARLSLSVALRQAAEAWTPLDRLQRRQVPDRMVLDADELADLLEHGLEALDAVGVDVFWPRGLRGELVPQGRVEVATGPREGQLMTRGCSAPRRCSPSTGASPWPATRSSDEEMSVLTGATSPVIRLRDNWMVIDPVLARRARKRVTAEKRQVAPVVALQASLTGTLYLDGGTVEVHPGATLEKVRDRIVDAAVVAPLPTPAGMTATLRDYQRHGFTWLAELTGVGLGACLADDMGLGKTVTLIALHLHRRERGLASGPTLVVCPASLMGNWEAEIHRFAPGVPVRRFHGSSRSLSGFETLAGARSSTTEGDADARSSTTDGDDDARSSTTEAGDDDGFVLHDVRHDAARRTRRSVPCRGTSSWPTRPSTSRTRSPRPRATCARSARAAGWP